ncbi:MAG: S1 RNA-binding domain-containing protein, partial [Proteobacteria bacterium]|nr:S1 RNA-binding domain-containing protein [Pseudomonadota bacterium]
HISEMSWSKRIKHPSKIVSIGDEVEVMILGVDVNTKRISLGIKQLEENPWDSIGEKYQVGDVIKGQVRNITDFGIFVAVEEGVDALIHVSDISWMERIKRPSENFYKGQEIEAKVLQIDPDDEKFSLGIKQLIPDPWDEIVASLVPGSRHTGTITKIMNFGIFVRVDKDFDGLIHVSELGLAHGERAYDMFKVDEPINYVVLSVDQANRKVSLSKVAYDLDEEELERYVQNSQAAKHPSSQRQEAPTESTSSPLTGDSATLATPTDLSEKQEHQKHVADSDKLEQTTENKSEDTVEDTAETSEKAQPDHETIASENGTEESQEPSPDESLSQDHQDNNSADDLGDSDKKNEVDQEDQS